MAVIMTYKAKPVIHTFDKVNVGNYSITNNAPHASASKRTTRGFFMEVDV
jgi:hypothetical protein